MSNSTMFRTRTYLRIGLIGTVLWAVPSCLWSQASSSSQQAHTGTAALFAGFDDLLTRAADTLIDSAADATPSTTAKAIVDEAPLTAQPRPLLDQASTLATARLDLLRPAVEPILTSHGVPANLAAVILIESGVRATALSPKGARGLWQLMPDTARRYGLSVNDLEDDRLDLFRSTEAAARYLHDLYAQFGDWRLALAAYNTGEANVGSAILRAHTQNFDRLSDLRLLPLETRNYVPRVLAAAQFSTQLSPFSKSHNVASAITVFAVSSR